MNRRIVCCLLLFIVGLLSGCSKESEITHNQAEQVPPSEQIDENDVNDTIDVDIFDDQEVELNNTYTTQYEEVNGVTYPAFSFEYPNGWTITQEDVTTESEWVTLTNERGTTVDFIHIAAPREIGGGSSTLYTKVEISKIADSSFVPGYVQATDYSDLGNFMVAELKTIATLDASTDTDFVTVEHGSISYAVVPENFAGTHTANKAYGMDFAFWYSGHILFRASPPNTPDYQFTSQEQKEVIAILASFRPCY